MNLEGVEKTMLLTLFAKAKHSQQKNHKFYDSKAIEVSKEFFDKSMVLVYLADMKDICDIAPCCELENYSVQQSENGSKYIHIEYDCTDLNLLFEIAGIYNAKGRAYALEKYVK